jgi:hypothetical protein
MVVGNFQSKLYAALANNEMNNKKVANGKLL